MSADQYAFEDPTKKFADITPKAQYLEGAGTDEELSSAADHGEETYRGSGRLEGRKALVTGGDSGIGAAVAIAYAREGADVAISYLPEEEEDAQRIVGLVEAAGRKAVALPGDITDHDFCLDLVAKAVEGLGGLDILVNNAGKQQHVEEFLDLDDETFDETYKTNVYAMFWITKAALPHLAPGSTIINTTSIQAYQPAPIARRLRVDEGRHQHLLEGPRHAARAEGHPRQRGRPGPDLDPAAAGRRPAVGRPPRRRQPDRPRPLGPARRARARLRLPGVGRVQLRRRRDPARRRRHAHAVT